VAAVVDLQVRVVLVHLVVVEELSREVQQYMLEELLQMVILVVLELVELVTIFLLLLAVAAAALVLLVRMLVGQME
jgi:hypothetical protein